MNKPGPRAAMPAWAVKRNGKAAKKKDGAKDNTKQKDTRYPSSDSYSDSAGMSDSDIEDAEDYKRGGYHPVQIGERFKDGKYTVLRKLGWGHFSTVWLVLNTETREYGAMKVQKSAKHYTEAAMDEITLLTQIKEGDPQDSKHCVRMLDWFEHHGPHGKHICIVFEVLGDNLLALIKQCDYKGIPIPVVKNLTRQMLVALDYLHSECRMIHTDFKPENVMLCEPLKDRTWELPDLSVPTTPAPSTGQPAKPQPAEPARPALQQQSGQSDQQQQQGSDVTGGSVSSGLTKNQKKRLKKKAKKAANKGGGGGGDDDDQEEDEEEVMSAAAAGTAGRGAGSNGHAAPQLTLHPPADPPAATEQQAQGQGTHNGTGDAAACSQPKCTTVLTVPGLTAAQLLTAKCKLVDFGNGCWIDKQFTDDVQTRQYRAPEVILGAKYSTPCDMWSLACMLFELVTGDHLFDPKSGKDYDRDEDHLAQFMELLGKMPKRVYERGKYASEYFNRHGELRHIKRLRFWPLDQVLIEKYHVPRTEARELMEFLMPMLEFSPDKRATAADMLNHPWLRSSQSKQAGGGGGDGGDSTALPPPPPRDDRHHHHHSRSPSPRKHSSGSRGSGRHSKDSRPYRIDGTREGRSRHTSRSISPRHCSTERPAKKSRSPRK